MFIGELSECPLQVTTFCILILLLLLLLLNIRMFDEHARQFSNIV